MHSIWLVLVLSILSSSVRAGTLGDLTYEVADGQVTITDCDEAARGDLAIPSQIEGLPVIGIGGSALEGCQRLTSVTIPEAVTSIGQRAFSECKNLTSITIPDGINSIENSVFRGCSRLTSIDIPDGVTSIGENAFRDCGITSAVLPDSIRIVLANAFTDSKLVKISIGTRVLSIASNTFEGCARLREINVAQGNFNYRSIDGVLFRTVPAAGWHGNYLMVYPANRNGSFYSVPEWTAGIETHAFKSVSNLISIEMSYTVMFIHKHAFLDCPKLRSIVMLASHFSAAGTSFEAFHNLPSLESFTVSKNIHSRETASWFGGELYEIYPWGWHVLPPEQPETEPESVSIRMAPVIMVQGEEGSVKTIEVADSPDGPWRFWMDVTATVSGVAITDLDGQAHKRFYRVRD